MATRMFMVKFSVYPARTPKAIGPFDRKTAEHAAFELTSDPSVRAIRIVPMSEYPAVRDLSPDLKLTRRRASYRKARGMVMGKIRDDRESKRKPRLGYVVATDSFMSGWGEAERGKSYYALAADTEDEAYTVMENLKDRPEMKRVRYVRTLPRLGPHDHLTVADRGIAPRYYEKGHPFQRDPARHKLLPRWSEKTLKRLQMRVLAAKSARAHYKRIGEPVPRWAKQIIASYAHPGGTAAYYREPPEVREVMMEVWRDPRRAGKYPPYPHGRGKVRKVLEEYKAHQLRSSSGRPVRSRRQAIAIALSEQRRAEGIRDPRRKAVRIPKARRAATSRRLKQLVREGYSPSYAARVAYHGRDPGKLTAAQKRALPARAFALPGRRQLPLIDPAHVRNAAARLAQMHRRGTVTASEYRRAHEKIRKVEVRMGIHPRSRRMSIRPRRRR